MIAKENLYLNSDKTKVVKESSPDQAFLLAGEGTEIPRWAMEQFDLKDNPTEPKAKTPATNKAKTPNENK